MLFSSMTFLFVFMPIVCTLYLFSKKELRNYVLLAASFIFYAWGEPRYLAIMILTILTNYTGAILVEKAKSLQHQKIYLIATILVNLSFLIYFKYFNFIVNNLNEFVNTQIGMIDVIMPIGISFYTFQGLSYVIDVYRKDVPAQKDIHNLALYITLFPQLVAGPIVKYHDVCEQIENRDVHFDKVVLGVKRFIIGLAKKVLIANTVAITADQIFALPIDKIDASTAWMGAICYTLQIYFDFSGYSDMAIGLGLIFGFKFLENFNYPYISKSITEFWRRWHISLSTWFKEYLYIPLGGNRISSTRTYVNLMIVFLATGIWHGASWTFIIWGLWNGFFIVLERFMGWTKDSSKYSVNIAKHFYTILVFMIGWVIFRADTFEYALSYIHTMFSFHGSLEMNAVVYDFTNKTRLAIIIGILCSMPVFSHMFEIKFERKVLRSLVNSYVCILLFFSTIALAASTYNPFIYFRF